MLYAIIARDIPASQERRLASRPAHLARLEQLKEEGRLVLAGPHPAIDSNDPGAAGFTGSLIVAEFDSLAAAQSWAEADPYRPPGCTPRWWSSRSRKSCPEAVAGYRRPARSPSRQTFSHRTPLSGARRSATRPARRFRQAGRANRKTVQSVASSVQGVMMRPSTAHCLLLSLSLGASLAQAEEPRQHRFQPRSLPLRSYRRTGAPPGGNGTPARRTGQSYAPGEPPVARAVAGGPGAAATAAAHRRADLVCRRRRHRPARVRPRRPEPRPPATATRMDQLSDTR